MVNAAVDAEILQRNRFTNISFKEDEKEVENVISASQLNQLLGSSNFGKPIHSSAIRKAFRVASDKLGFKVKAHTLRHTYASLLISSGVDVVTVASRLGDTAAMVFKVYAHAVDENKNQTIEVFKNVLENN